MYAARLSSEDDRVCMARAICALFNGSTRRTADEPISAVAVRLEVITGVFRCIASKIGNPNPSYSDIKHNAMACAYK